jgi:beta-glucanase (GH16 family)
VAIPQPLGQSGTWNLIFSDEFNGTSLDTSKWTPGWFGSSISGPVNSAELACYDSKHATVPGDGSLHLLLDTTRNTCKSTLNYTGALVSSNGKFQYAYGYVEFHVYLPASGASVANWPATWSDGQSWPTDGENDTMEGLGGDACVHFHSPAGGPGACVPGNFTGWHTFASWWQPGIVTYYYDGVLVGTITLGITSAPQYLIIENTLESSSPQVVPADMLVDYVRVWTPAGPSLGGAQVQT